MKFPHGTETPEQAAHKGIKLEINVDNHDHFKIHGIHSVHELRPAPK